MMKQVIIEYSDQGYKKILKEKVITGWIREVLREVDRAGHMVSISFVGLDEIQEINKEYRGKDMPTDVLSFSQVEGEPFDFENTFLGDIVVSVPYAETQAALLGHDTVTEVRYLLLHGVLHLLGYDHDESDNGEMQLLEKKIYTKLTGEFLE